MNALVDVILPVFLLVGFGWGAARAGLIPDLAVDGIMRFSQTFALPCLLFSSIARLDLAANFDLGLFLSYYIGAFTSFTLGFFGSRRLFGRSTEDAVAIGFACMFSNSLFLGLPITERAYGPEALASNFAIIALHSPMLYGFGITAMEMARSHGMGLSTPRLVWKVVSAVFSQPLVIGVTLGLLVNLSGLHQPAPIEAAVALMARAALPTALFGLGGVLLRYHPDGDMKLIAMICGLSLVVHPAITWGLGVGVFGLDTSQLRSAVVTAAVAPGVNAYLFSHLYGAAKRVTAAAVLIATSVSILTTWAWLHILP